MCEKFPGNVPPFCMSKYVILLYKFWQLIGNNQSFFCVFCVMDVKVIKVHKRTKAKEKIHLPWTCKSFMPFTLIKCSNMQIFCTLGHPNEFWGFCESKFQTWKNYWFYLWFIQHEHIMLLANNKGLLIYTILAPAFSFESIPIRVKQSNLLTYCYFWNQ